MKTFKSLPLHDLINGRRKSTPLLVMLCLGLALALQVSRPANAQNMVNCAAPVTSAPTGPATVSAASRAYGKVLVTGSPGYSGCSLYVLTADELRALTSDAVPFACGDLPNVVGASCDTILWPALLTEGAPIAGPGVNPTLLGTVTRTDILPGQSVQQVTYAGQPLYRIFTDETPGETEGENLFDPVTSPTGVWYMVEPSRGRPAPGQARVTLETAQVDGTGPEQTVLAVTLNNNFSIFPNASFPVYTLSAPGGVAACNGVCAIAWPPVLTSMQPEAGAGIDQHDLGSIIRHDGTRQLTYKGQPLYLFYADAYIGGVTGTQGINGQGKSTPWGVFNAISPTP